MRRGAGRMGHAVAILAGVVGLVAVRCPAQTASPSAPPTGSQLAAAALAALTHGVAVENITLSGQVTRYLAGQPATGDITLEATASGQSRVEYTVGADHRIEFRDDNPAQPTDQWENTDGSVHAMAQHNCWVGAAWFAPIFSGAARAADSHWGISNAGTPAESTGALDHLQLARLPLAGVSDDSNAVIARLSAADLLLDPQTLLPAELDFNLHPDDDYGRNVPVRVVYSGYQAVAGIEVPFHIQQYLQNALFLDIQVQSANVNTGLALSPLAATQ